VLATWDGRTTLTTPDSHATDNTPKSFIVICGNASEF